MQYDRGRKRIPALRLSAAEFHVSCAIAVLSLRVPTADPGLKFDSPRHAAVVRVTHWLTVIAFLALLLSGAEIIVPHPRFYWGEAGNVNTHPAFTLPIPASRDTVPTSYGYVMPDENGWGRALHFEAAWVAVLTGLAYVVWGVFRGHFRRRMLPERGQRLLPALGQAFMKSLRFSRPGPEETHSYNALQRISYLIVIFVFFPLIIWTGLAMSPAFTAAFPQTVTLLGGRQTARTLHLFVTVALVAFLAIHLCMITLAGFWRRTRAMITGHAAVEASATAEKERA